MGELERVAFQIIAAVGEARSCYVEAIHAAKEHDFGRAQELMDKGEQEFYRGHDAHTGLSQREAGGDPIAMNLMLAHAEDQLMSAETFRAVAVELIDMCKCLPEA